MGVDTTAVEAGRKWLTNQPESVRKVYAGVEKDEAALEVLGKGVLLQTDYTRKTQETAAEKAEAEKLRLEAQETRKKQVEWQEKASKEYSTALEESARLRAGLTEAQGKLQVLAKKHGISEDEIKLQMAATGESADSAAESVKDQGGSAAVREEGITKDVLAQNNERLVDLQVEFMDIQGDHAELFGGKRLKFRELVNEAASAGADNLRKFWEEKYKVSDRREEIAAKEKADWEEQIRKEEREKVQTELVGAGGMQGAPGRRPRGQGPTAMERIQKVNAERDGKVKDGDPPQEFGIPGTVGRAVSEFLTQRQQGDEAT